MSQDVMTCLWDGRQSWESQWEQRNQLEAFVTFQEKGNGGLDQESNDRNWMRDGQILTILKGVLTELLMNWIQNMRE